MKKKKKIIIAAAASAVLLVSVTGVIIWKHGSGNDDSTKVFVTPVSDINTVNSATSLSGQCFSGVIESQKTLDVKYDTSRKATRSRKELNSLLMMLTLWSFSLSRESLKLKKATMILTQ